MNRTNLMNIQSLKDKKEVLAQNLTNPKINEHYILKKKNEQFLFFLLRNKGKLIKEKEVLKNEMDFAYELFLRMIKKNRLKEIKNLLLTKKCFSFSRKLIKNMKK